MVNLEVHSTWRNSYDLKYYSTKQMSLLIFILSLQTNFLLVWSICQRRVMFPCAFVTPICKQEMQYSVRVFDRIPCGMIIIFTTCNAQFMSNIIKLEKLASAISLRSGHLYVADPISKLVILLLSNPCKMHLVGHKCCCRVDRPTHLTCTTIYMH